MGEPVFVEELLDELDCADVSLLGEGSLLLVGVNELFVSSRTFFPTVRKEAVKSSDMRHK